ncbi:MAG: ribose-phosphate diphosphokinase [Puniceicoccales bacterium]|jgi:ribose-phosphate pyrophosphokinase|nr:ribose-phosphate diphosphokinase [Puniceicoccales bacterium]
MKLLAGRAHRALAEKISSYLQVPLGEVDISDFPNGETHVQIKENIAGHDVFLIQSMHESANQHIMELLLLIDAVRRAAAARITAVIPFFGYARQDHNDHRQMSISAKLIANLLVTAGIHRLLTLDLHHPQIAAFFDIPVDHLSATSVFMPYIEEQNWGPLSIASPDLGGLKRAAVYAEMLHCPLVVLRKRRKEDHRIEIIDAIGEMKDRHILLVDDMVETGHTLCVASEFLRQRGAISVRAIVSHGAWTHQAMERIRSSGIEELVVTNSIPMPQNIDIPIHVLDTTTLFGDAIRRIHKTAVSYDAAL